MQSGRLISTLLVMFFTSINLGLFVLASLLPSNQITLSSAAIRPEAGHNYTATFADPLVFPLTFGWDTPSAPQQADAVVMEGRRRLGPGHSAHADIRRLGAGRYSFWSGTLYFSTSDNSDPRGNGRAYRVRARPRPHPAVAMAVLILDLVGFAVFRRQVAAFAAARVAWIAAGVVVVFACFVLMAAVGLRPPVFGESEAPVDAALVGSIVVHLLFGLAFTLLTFATGVGCLLWVTRGNQHPLPDLLLRAILPGAIVVGGACLVRISFRSGWLLAALVCVAALLPLLAYRPRRADVVQVSRCLAHGLPISLLFAALTALWWHGPTRTLAGAPIGDTAIYVGMANTLSQHAAPFFNYAVEGFRLTYANSLVSLFAAPWVSRPWFDPYLFYSASLGVLFGLSLFLLPLLKRQVSPADARSPPVVDRLIIGGLIAGAFRFPSDFVQSPPFVLLVPIVIATVHLWSFPHPGGRPWQSLVAAAFGTAISKVVAFIVLVPLALPAVAAGLLRGGGPRLKLMAAAVGTIGLAYIVVVLVLYLPAYLKLGLFGPSSIPYLHQMLASPSVWTVGLLARDIGSIVLAIAVARSGPAGLALGVVAGVASFLLVPFLGYASLTAAMLATAFAILVKPQSFGPTRRTLLAATVFLLVAPLTPLFDSWAIIAAWLALVWFVVQGTAAGSASGWPPRGPLTANRRRGGGPAIAAGLLAVVLAGAASGALNLSPASQAFTPDMRDIWLTVRRLTPKESLIFTDQTGPTEDRLGGWNDFAQAAQRQFYIVSWEVTPLRFDIGLRRQWLDRNAAVLAGTLDPRRLRLSRPYDGYFAVVSNARVVGGNFTEIYKNPSFTLYRVGQLHE